ncbi:MAG: 6-bladed beta-propeller, partial [Bacteroidota bacterium]
MKSNRRNFLKTTVTAASTALVLPSSHFNIIGKAKDDDSIIGHGDYRYRVHQEWGNLNPDKTPVFNCHEMVQDSQGRLIMVNDEVKNNILIYDRSGKLLDAWGTQFPGGHGLTLSAEGEEDFLFIADCGWFFKNGKWDKQAGKIVKTTTDGRLIFSLGHPLTIGVYNEDEPFMPTEIAVAPNGDFYVADGYGSDYILQYDHQGQFIRRFGGHNNENPDRSLSNAHGVAVDLRNPDQPKLICTSRNENAFKFFTLDGEYLETVKLPGAFVCRPVMDDENIYAGVCWSTNPETGKRTDNSGFVTVLDKDNKVVSNPGGNQPEYEDGELQPIYQVGDIFYHGHDVCVGSDKNLYVCQWNAN